MAETRMSLTTAKTAGRPASLPSASQKGRSPYFRRLGWTGLMLALPAIAHLGIFGLYPVLRNLYLSFTSWGLSGTPKFIGLGNYVRLFHDAEFIHSVRVTLTYSLALSLSISVLALAIALLFDRHFIGRDFFRAVYFVPVVIPWVVTAITWNLIYNPSYGLYHIITDPLHIPQMYWIQNPRLIIIALLVMGVWKGFGYYMVIYLAGLQGIPIEFYEAAQVDGANRLSTFRHITVPLLRPTILVVAVGSLVDSFQVFTPVWLMTQGGPAAASRMLSIFTYQNGFVFLKMGYAAAVAMLMLVALVVATRIQMAVWKPLT
jgi:multiple sugar transport system permease protein